MEAEAKTKSDNEIQLRKNEDILRLKIRDAEGNDTGNYLEFDLQSIELLERYQKMFDEDKKARENLQRQFVIIEKKQDHKGKKLLTYKQELQVKAIKDFYNKEIEIYNLFLGENGVQKLLNGREVSWYIFEEINDIIKNDIIPKLKINSEDIKNNIVKKYSNKRDDIIE